ncbi:gliding motility protein GldJ [Nonlabens ulvanivorans]|uniref:Gliding motility protein GldJ n=1 Tax=Nonlabens ulvanivorans TaxID=906888 RepID=A0A081DBP2_NONUL|nr:gliding motility lipoprotein GldK [Nonlabens ulvanivorans]GAK76338.1 gliding motility protein GldJ [Nonlabens ulvanivorans]GAL74749.1 gliding motility protein GldJ [Nonlabens ulvanivorans]
MKKLFVLAAVVAFLASCGRGDRGMVVGAKGKAWHPEKPYGMTLVPGGAFIMGKSDDDFAATNNAPTKTVTVPSFYMDETEITNAEYRQFVYWVRDSIFRTRLAIMADDNGSTPGDDGIGEFAFLDADESTDLTPWEQYYQDNYAGMGETGYEGRKLNHDVDLIWDTEDIPDEFYAEVYDSMYIPFEEMYNGQRTLDVKKLVFTYSEMDIQKAARNPRDKRSKYITQTPVEIYPDTTVWIRDFNYSYNEPMHNDYFWHEAYSDYPVVGVNWKQAKAFCQWRTLYHNAFRKERGRHNVNAYRLPTEAEWEYAARGGLEGATYPWGGGPYAKNDRGCFLANFKPLRGDYAADQALYTVEARSYEPNEYNLFNMSGNVAEWVNSSYDAGSYEFMSSMSPVVNDENNMRKGVRGGSWKDISYFLQVGTRDYEYADSARSYIGFRTVQSYMGTDVTLNAATN